MPDPEITAASATTSERVAPPPYHRVDLLTWVTQTGRETPAEGWYIAWHNFRDFVLSDPVLHKDRNPPVLRDYALWAYTLLSMDAVLANPPPFTSIIVEAKKAGLPSGSYPGSFHTEPGWHRLIEPITLADAMISRKLTLLHRQSLPRDIGAQTVFYAYMSELRLG